MEAPKQNKTWKILGITTKSVCIVIVIMAIIFMIRAVVYKKYDIFGYRFYMIMSGSMEPTIKVGDAVIAKEIKEPQKGDIIAFQNDSYVTVHRIVKEYTEGDKKLYQTKGDNNNTEDKGLIQKEQIVGKIVLRIPKAGNIILFLQKNIVIISILIIGIVIIGTLVRRLI